MKTMKHSPAHKSDHKSDKISGEKIIPTYTHEKIEKKWQKKWQSSKIYKTSDSAEKPKAYILDMFPYPSGTGLHVGHPKGYIATDVYSRFKTMNGFNVLHPMGWDAFGLPAEEFAIKNKIHPSIAVKKNIATYKQQLSILGFNYDWSREVNTTDPEYYKWTQWAFLQMHKKGLTFESHEPINWCPSCKTGLANEDLENGLCERCGSVVEKRPLRQWVIRITDYAERLLEDIDALHWPESIKEQQKNWIGKSEGVNLLCTIKGIDGGTDMPIEMYDSIPQTFFAQTFAVIGADHPLLPKIVAGVPNEKEILDFAKQISKKKSSEGPAYKDTIEGIFTGRMIDYPAGDREIPLWIASYAVSDYGTGIVSCSAHDERDFKFAKKYNIPLKTVLFPENDPELREKIENNEVFYREPNGVLDMPMKFRGRKWYEVRKDVITHLVSNGWARKTINYKLRDWVFSRQRYWGEPIPLIHCPDCGVVPVPEKELPLKLPNVKSYEPTGTGESPLAAISSWVNVKCPQCKGKAKRETNTMPQWAGSCWYYLRYIDPKNKKQLVDPAKEKYWQPVDMYVGGAEHATRHLIYARFWHKFLFDIGVVTTSEPFSKLKNQGLIMGPDGRKMSKRFGNVVNPDDMVKTYGADTLRVYEMFMGPFDQTIAWSTDNMIGSRRFIEKFWRLFGKIDFTATALDDEKATSKATLTLLHKTIKKVGEDIEDFSFNTAISTMMILLNALEKEERVALSTYFAFLRILSPFAPHASEELFDLIKISAKKAKQGSSAKNILVEIKNIKSIHLTEWPKYNPDYLVSDEVIVLVQINGKVRSTITTNIEDAKDEEKMKNIALQIEEIRKRTGDNSPDRIIFIPGKVINLVFKSL